MLGKKNHTTIILGANSDPFYPFEGKFHFTLKVIEALCESQVQQIVIQTRSPLIVLALPLLSSLRDKLVITMALESRDEQLHLRHSPQFPRPAERIKAARALKRAGFTVAIQAAPPKDERNIAGYASLIDELSSFIILPLLSKKTPYGTFVVERDRTRTLRTILGSICPNKLLESALDCFSIEEKERLMA